jgi:hypothetical protein
MRKEVFGATKMQRSFRSVQEAIRTAIVCAGLVAFAPQAGLAAGSGPPGIEVVDIPLIAWVASRDHASPGTLANFDTDEERRSNFRAFVDALATGMWADVNKRASSLSYQVVAIREGDGWFVVASDDSATGRDPTLVVNLSARRDVLIEAPHVPFERGTGEQSIVLLKDLGGRAAILSGAHRCASKSFTRCDGRTTVCGVDEAYRDSDVGHNVSALFHTAHTTLAERWENAIVLSLHGMKTDTDDIRTSLIISNGIRAPDQEQKTAATRLRLGLGSMITPPGTVVSCNVPGDEVYNYRKLCGYTNVQGRHVNGDADACRDSVDQGSGRFIHLEQDWAILRPYAQNWSRIEEHAIGQGLARMLTTILPTIP